MNASLLWLKNIFDKTLNWIYEKKNIILPLLLVLFIITYCFHMIYPTAYFFPIDGNYQNYNVVRRLLAGQIPYKDFIVYLGPLHLYLGTFFTWLFGGKFVSCVFAYNFLTMLTFVFLSWILTKIFDFKFSKMCLISLIFFIVAYLVAKYTNMFTLSNKIFVSYIETGVSGRFFRMLPLLFAALAIYLIDKNVESKNYKALFYGACAGFVFPCSNDFGIVAFISLFILFFIKEVCSYKNIYNFLKNVLWYFVGSITSLALTVVTFSQGHVFEWFQGNFGIGSEQWSYFTGEKTCYLYDLNINFLILCQIVFVLFCLYKLIKSIKHNDSIQKILKYEVLFLLNLCCAMVVQEFNYIGGNHNFEVQVLIFIVCAFYIIIDLLSKYITKILWKYLLLIVVCFSLIFSLFNILSCFKKTEAVYIDAIGGKLSDYSKDVMDAKNFVGNEKVFSTYASALEDVTNQFQPSGYDYIIHVLGKNAKKNYIDAFNKKDFKYVVTQNYSSSWFWEFWARNRNWYFYKEMYKYYVPVYINNYLIIYSKNYRKDSNLLPKDTKIEYIPFDKNKGRIVIETDSTISGMADLHIDYSLKASNIIAKIFIFRKYLKIFYANIYPEKLRFSESPFHINLNSEEEKYVEIPIINGKGEIYIEARPLHNIKLVVNSLKADYYYKTPFKYIEISETDEKNNTIKINNTYLNKKILYKVNEIKYDTDTYKIDNIKLDENFIYIQLKETIKKTQDKIYFIELGDKSQKEIPFIYNFEDAGEN